MPSPWYKKQWVIILAVLVVGAGVGLVAATALQGDEGDGPSTAPASSSSSPTSPPETAGAVDGCLGGSDLATALMVAQDTAPLTSEGLAALARTTLRWLLQYPVPDDAEETLQQLTGDPQIAADMLADINTKAAELEASGYTSAEVDLSKGGYRLSSRDVSGTEGELAEIDILVYRTVVRAGQTEEQRLIIGPDFTIKQGRFTYGLQDPEPPADRPDSEFTAYAGGC